MTAINQHAAHWMIVQQLQPLITVVQWLNQGFRRELGVIIPVLTFWFFCVKTKERIVVLAQHFINSNLNL